MTHHPLLVFIWVKYGEKISRTAGVTEWMGNFSMHRETDKPTGYILLCPLQCVFLIRYSRINQFNGNFCCFLILPAYVLLFLPLIGKCYYQCQPSAACMLTQSAPSSPQTPLWGRNMRGSCQDLTSAKGPMMSSHGNAFCITGPLPGESTGNCGNWWFTLKRASNADL